MVPQGGALAADGDANAQPAVGRPFGKYLIVDRLATEIQAVLKEPAVVKRWEEIGAEGSTMSPAEVGRFVQAEIDKWTPVVKASGAKPE